MHAATRVASTSAVVALVLATVWLFWPSGLGGGTTYVTTYGTSMEPDFSEGDLALLSRADSYSVGDVVAYPSDSMGTIVMHRIVAVEADRFVTQGDNNDWLDDDRPTQDQIRGRLWVRIPQGGTALTTLRSPGVFLPLTVLMTAVVGVVSKPPVRRNVRALHRRIRGVSSTTRTRASRPGRGAATFPEIRSRAQSLPVRARARQVALGAGGVTLLAAIACAVLLMIPTAENDIRTLEVGQQGQFSYTGDADPGTTYPTGDVSTGDTVWTRLVDDLTVSFTNTVTGADPAALTGALHLDVVVAAPDGWTAVVTSGPPAVLQQGTATAEVVVDTHEAMQLLERHQKETGSPGGSATLTVTPMAGTTGTIQGHGFTADPPAGLAFTLDATSLRPQSTEAGAYRPAATTQVDVDVVVPRSLAVSAFTVPIGVARMIAGAVLLISLATFCLAAWVAQIGRGGVADNFVVRHADRILPVASFSPGGTVIDVSDAESLHRVAERFDTVVLHHAGEDEDIFAVRDVDATYRFVVPVGPDGRRGKPPVPAASRAWGATAASQPQPEPVADLTAPLGLRGRFA